MANCTRSPTSMPDKRALRGLISIILPWVVSIRNNLDTCLPCGLCPRPFGLAGSREIRLHRTHARHCMHRRDGLGNITVRIDIALKRYHFLVHIDVEFPMVTIDLPTKASLFFGLGLREGLISQLHRHLLGEFLDGEFGPSSHDHGPYFFLTIENVGPSPSDVDRDIAHKRRGLAWQPPAAR